MNRVRKAIPLSRAKIRELTIYIRRSLGVEGSMEFPTMYVLEYVLPDLIEGFSFEIIDDKHMDCEALTYPNRNLIKIKESVYERACSGRARDLFTIAHEMGHLFLHRGEKVGFARSEREVRAYEDPEWQANTFAAELLAPSNMLRGLGVDEICEKCKVSRQVAEIQSKYS